MANEDVLIIGKLDDKDLLKSIDKLVSDVADKSQEMANKFETAMNKMTGAMKDFAITQKVSVDLMKEAWKDMSASFDAMFKAQSEAAGGGKGSGKPTFADNTVGALEQEIAELKKERKEMELNSDVLREQNKIIDERSRKLKEQTTNLATLRLDRTMRMPSNDLDAATKKLRALEILQRRYKDSTELSEQQQKRLADAIVRTKKEIDRINSSKPKTLKDVLGMDESTVDAVTKKMRALRTVTVNPQNKHEVNALGNEYQRLSRLQAELLGKGIQLTHSNNYLAQSFGYIRNRIVYALTLGAVTNFTKQVYEIRGQYELLERSLGILINDMRKGTEMFNELNAMALKSPFTLMELATGAKQLLAYNFAEEEVVDTTRRLADISAALGVPMERLVYNLGQIKAQTALTARDARDFANAGLAIVPMLAQMYTEEKRFGDEIVTTAQVFDMMSKKMVSYNDVMKVINKVTDEGGKFFDFQAKQADTLRVKMANLTLAWNNMLNEVGQDNQGVLELPLRGLKTLFENWRALVKVVKEVILVFGAYKAAAMLVSLWNSRLAAQGAVMAFFELAKSVRSAKDAMILFNTVCKLNPIGLIASAIAAAVGYFYLFNDAMDDAGGYTEKFGKAGAKVINETEALFDTLKGISRESSNYKKVMGELNSILEEYGIETVKETDGMNVLNEKRRVAIALIKEETLERKHLNDVQQGRDDFQGTANEAKEKFKESLKNALTGNDLLMTADDSLRKNSEAIANIIGDVIENNITLIAGKTGEEYQKGVEQIYAKIREKMRAIELDESTIDSQWVEKRWHGQVNIVDEYITKIKEAKEAQDDYTKAIDAAYESEKKAAESGASFNDRVEQTQTQLMKAANDTENFYKKIDQLVKDYSGENIIGFLVKVKTEVPAWMSQKGLTELTQLSARFTALATNAKKAGKSSLNVNGSQWTVEQLFERAAQYTQAAQNKAADIEARKSSTITREASEALKAYKSAIEAVNVAKNKLKRGSGDQALVTEKEAEAQKAYNKALEKGVSLEELRKAKNGKGGSGSKKDRLGDALTKEVQLVSDMQKLYKEYQKAGVDSDTARIATAKEYEKTLKSTNAELAKFGIKGLSGEELSTMDVRALRDYYTQLRDIASMKGNTKGVEALEKAIRNLNIEITKIDYKKITEGLNNELGKIKDDYELAVELDANPELGDIFADMFGIDTNKLPQTFGESLDRAQDIINRKLSDLNIASPFDIMQSDVNEFANSSGLEKESDAIKELAKWQNTFRDMFKKNILDSEKMLDDYVKKYGGYSDKIAEIEADRLEKIKKLNDAYYTEEMRQRPEYIAKMNAINQGASREKSNVEFDAFKNSRYYTMMFENLDYVSTKTIRDMRDRLRELMDSMKDLTPEQLKQVMTQYEKLEQKLVKRRPFKTLAKDLKNYLETSGDRKAANEAFRNAQKEYDAQEKNVAALKEKYEQAKANNYTSKSYLDFLEIEINGENEILQVLKKQLEIAEKKADKYNLIKKLALEELSQTATMVSENLKSLAELRDQMNELFGVDASKGETLLGHKIDGVIDGLAKASDGISKITSSAQSGNVFGVVGGVVDTFVGIGDAIASAFGGGSAKTRRLNREINESKEVVRQLSMAYDDLERSVSKSLGTAETEARRAAIANKELQLSELERQKTLEESKRSKDRDDDAIKQYEETIHSLRNEISDLKEDVINNLWGDDVKSAAEAFVDAWVQAWRAGETTLDAIKEKMDEMIYNLIKKAMTSKIVETLLNPIYDELNRMTKEGSEGGIALTTNELRLLAQQAGVTAEQINVALGEFYGNLEQLGVASKTDNENNELSALQQGIQGITEDTAGALEAYMNGVSQQVYLHSDLLTQIRDTVMGFDLDVQVATMSQMLLQLQSNYQLMQTMATMMDNWTNAAGNGIRVELLS